MKKKTIINTAILVSLIGATISGTTFAYYNLNNKNNIKINTNSISFLSSKVNNSLESSFSNGGSCAFDDKGNLNISRMTLNDEIKFSLNIKNTSVYDLKFKLDVNCLEGFDMFSNLDIDTVLESYINLKPNEEKNVPVKIKCMSNKQSSSNSKISFEVKGYQNNANVQDTLLKKVNINESIKFTGNNNFSSTNRAFNIFVPKGKYLNLDEVSIKINNTELTAFNIENNKPKVAYELTSNGLIDNDSNLKCSLFIGKNLTNVKLYQLQSGTTQILDSIDYDKNSGYLTFITKKLNNKICVEADELTHFVPCSDNEVELGEQFINFIANLTDESRVVFDDNVNKITLSQPIQLKNKKLALVGLNNSYGIGNTTFELTEPINIEDKSILDIEYININSNNDVFNLSDNSTLNIYSGNFNVEKNNKSFITSKATNLGTPLANIYDGKFITEKNNSEIIKPFLYETKNDLSIIDGKIRVHGGEFINFNPGESFYKINNVDYYKSHLTEGQCSYLYNNVDSTDKTYGVTYFLLNNYDLSNKKIFDYSVEEYSNQNIDLKNDIWVAPSVKYESAKSVVSLFKFIHFDEGETQHLEFSFGFEDHTINFALNDDILETIKQKDITLTILPSLLNTNINFYFGFRNKTTNFNKVCFNPTIHKKDGSIIYEKSYGIIINDLLKSCKINFKNMLMTDKNSVVINAEYGLNHINFDEVIVNKEVKDSLIQQCPSLISGASFTKIPDKNDLWMCNN